MKPKPKTVDAAELSTIKMVAGNEKKYSLVIDGGIVKRWVGFGWVDEGPPSKNDLRRLPTVTRKESNE